MAEPRKLCDLEGGGEVLAVPGGDIHISIPVANAGYSATMVIDSALLDLLAREWMDRQGIIYRVARITGVTPDEPSESPDNEGSHDG